MGSRDALDAAGRELVHGVMPLRAGVRLIGLSLSGLGGVAGNPADRQLVLPL